MMRIGNGIKIFFILILMTGCSTTSNGKLYMEFKSDVHHMKISHDKIVVERIIARW